MKRNINNADLINLLEKENGRLLYDEAEGSIVSSADGRTILTDILSGEALERALKSLRLEKPEMAVVKSSDAQQAITALYGLTSDEYCTQWVYDSPQPPVLEEHIIRPLTKEQAPLAAAHYGLFDDALPYISQRIENGLMWGLFEADELAGFIGVHGGGSMGMLEILPQYRRRGYGMALERFLIAQQLAAGYIPFAHVIDGNTASFALQQKLGMRLCELPVIWMG